MADTPTQDIKTSGLVDGKPTRSTESDAGSEEQQKQPTEYRVSFPDPKGAKLPEPMGAQLNELSQLMGRPVVLLCQNLRVDSDLDMLGMPLYDTLFSHLRPLLARDVKPVIVIQSPGGTARGAYLLAKLFQKKCGGYSVIVPRYAKSAATLFALGADEIVMSEHGELGPLDAQIDDADRETQMSALEVVQSVERLNKEAMEAVDSHMNYLLRRSGKKVEFLLPTASHFVSELMNPLFDKIDTVRFTQMARLLKVGQDYAERLLRRKYDRNSALDIAALLTEAYADHGFVIDSEEMERIGLEHERPDGELAHVVDSLCDSMPLFNTFVGLVQLEGGNHA